MRDPQRLRIGIYLPPTPHQSRRVGASAEHEPDRELLRQRRCGGFWAVLKEEIGTRFWPDRTTARADIFNFIKTFYNRRRLRKHIHWGYLTPHETRLRYRQDQALAAKRHRVQDHGETSQLSYTLVVSSGSRSERGEGQRRSRP